METEKIFRTKTGFCHVTADKIILTRDGVIGNISNVTIGNNISRILIIYGFLSIGLIYFAYNSYVKNYDRVRAELKKRITLLSADEFEDMRSVVKEKIRD